MEYGGRRSRGGDSDSIGSIVQYGKRNFLLRRRYLAWISASDLTVHVMDLKTRKDACEPLKIESKEVFMQMSPDAKVLAVGCKEGLFYIWNWRTRHNPKPLKTSDGEFAFPRLFTVDNKHLVISSVVGHTESMDIWDVATSTKLSAFPGNPSNKSCTALAVSSDGKWAIATFYDHGPVQVIDLEKCKIAREIKVDPAGGEALAFSPDGHVIAFGDGRINAFGKDLRPGRSDVRLVEFDTGESIARFRGHHSGVLAFQFTSDGRTLYSGGCDSTILKWDATARHGKGRSTPTPEAAWQALAQEASKAYPASWDLVDEPKQAVELLRHKIKPAKKLELKEIQAIVDLLDADKFAAREKAAKDLQSLGYSAEPILRKLLETEKRVEVKQRIETILDRLNSEFVRTRRALQVLETINNAGRQRVDPRIGGSMLPENRLTNEAAIVLKRLSTRAQRPN